MDYDKFIDDVKKELMRKAQSKRHFEFKGNHFVVYLVYAKKSDDFNLPFILMIPDSVTENTVLAVESNNLETENNEDILKNGLMVAQRLATTLCEYQAPVLVPLILSTGNTPYYQHLSKECFGVDESSLMYRVDIQVKNIIEKAKKIIAKKTGVNIQNDIFLNGYSSSGVFAQRFALVQPSGINTVCVGGASSSIPIIHNSLNYPIGTGDYYEVTNDYFDKVSYDKITFRYYVGSLEDSQKSTTRFDEDGLPAPMYDMSYLSRSVPKAVGHKQRLLFGRNIIERSTNEIELMKNFGLDIEQVIFEGRTHNNSNGKGVNELGSAYIKQCYSATLSKNKKL